jgi:sec-independent protein translocase protein TatB
VFGIGGSEILVILVVALLFLGPDKLPDAAKQISKGIRDLKKQSRILQHTIENDEHIGGAIRDLKSALRGDEIPVRPPVRKLPENTIKPQPGGDDPVSADAELADAKPDAKPDAEPDAAEDAAPAALAEAKAGVTLPPVAGDLDPDGSGELASDGLAELIKPPLGQTAAREPDADPIPEPPVAPKLKHG